MPNSLLSRPSRWILPILAVAILACSGGAAPPADEAAKPALVSKIDLATASTAPIASGPRISGSLEPATQAVLRAEAGGTVTQVGAEIGDRVEAGHLLAKIENRGVSGQVTSARSGVTASQVDVTNARRELERARTLSQAGAVSGRDVEMAEAQVAAAEARLAQARGGLATAGEAFDGVNLKSPIAGLVAQRQVSLGDVVAPGTPLFTVIDPSSLRLEGSVPASAIGQVAIGSKVLFEVQGQPGVIIEGVVDRVSPAVDPVTRQLPILVSVPNADGKLVAGLFADGRVTADIHEGLVLPADAVDLLGTAPSVLRVRDGKVERVEVTLGTSDLGAERVEIATGLAEGDQVLIGAARDVEPGSTVEIGS